MVNGGRRWMWMGVRHMGMYCTVSKSNEVAADPIGPGYPIGTQPGRGIMGWGGTGTGPGMLRYGTVR